MTDDITELAATINEFVAMRDRYYAPKSYEDFNEISPLLRVLELKLDVIMERFCAKYQVTEEVAETMLPSDTRKLRQHTKDLCL